MIDEESSQPTLVDASNGESSQEFVVVISSQETGQLSSIYEEYYEIVSAESNSSQKFQICPIEGLRVLGNLVISLDFWQSPYLKYSDTPE